MQCARIEYGRHLGWRVIHIRTVDQFLFAIDTDDLCSGSCSFDVSLDTLLPFVAKCWCPTCTLMPRIYKRQFEPPICCQHLFFFDLLSLLACFLFALSIHLGLFFEPSLMLLLLLFLQFCT